MNFKYLVVEGPIGAGKTTLAEKLAAAFKSKSLLDRPWDNPFLKRFYDGQSGSAFQAQLYFLAERATLLKELTRNFPRNEVVISDFLLEKDKLFAFLNLTDQELAIYNRLFDAISDYLVKPDLVIYLKAGVDVLLERIHGREIDMEQRITPAYLQNLVEAYEHFFFQYQQRTRIPVLVMETAQIDFTSGGPKMDDFINFLRVKNVSGLQYYSPTTKG